MARALRPWRLLPILLWLLPGCIPRLPRVVKIGLVAPFEGRDRPIGYDAIYAARLAVRQINEAGGAGGWKLALVAYDDRGEAAMARAAARNLLTDENVVAVIGHYRQSTTEAAAPLYAQDSLSLIVIGAWVTPTTTTWHLTPPPEAVATAMVTAMADLQIPARRVACWGTSPPIALACTEAARRGYQIVSASTDRPAFPAAVVLTTLSPVRAAERWAARRDAMQTGYLIGGPTLAADAFAAVAGDAAEGSRFVTPYPFPADVLTTTAWQVAYRAVGPHVPPPGPYALPTYEAVRLLAEAIAEAARAGRPDRATLAATLPTVRHEGFLGPIAWDARGYWHHAPLYTYIWHHARPMLAQTPDR